MWLTIGFARKYAVSFSSALRVWAQQTNETKRRVASALRGHLAGYSLCGVVTF